jgi:hypothetical protein
MRLLMFAGVLAWGLSGMELLVAAESSSLPFSQATESLPGNLQSIAVETLRPYRGPGSAMNGRETLVGKVMCGYQGWFSAEGDGSGRGWNHWTHGATFAPGSCKIDLWPDVSELTPEERYATAFHHADGRVAEVFSSMNRQTVLRHFKWMKDYGIDGVFVQRFAVELFHERGFRQVNVVLDHCREGANRYGRTYAVMYDLSGLKVGQMQRVKEDWKLLVDRMQITRDPAYQHHAGKPVLAIWGLGFNDHRDYTFDEGLDLVKFLKSDPKYGGCTVMLGVPAYWRTLNRDSVNDHRLHELVLQADIVSPWTVGRYTNPETAIQYATNVLKADLQWCRERGKELMPVVFPGFSWHNMFPKAPFNQIPRLKGKFLWTQFAQAKKSGATMIYQAMFDELDEGTAIFKCTDDPPVGASRFLDFEGLPSDFYLRLVGCASAMLRGEIPVTDQLPDLK